MTEKTFAGCTFEPAQAETMLGKTVLVSLTCMNDYGDLDAFEQFAGEIMRISHEDGLVVKRIDNGEEMNLPPDLDHYQVAEPGQYKLAESEVVIENPDFLVEWDIYPPDKE